MCNRLDPLLVLRVLALVVLQLLFLVRLFGVHPAWLDWHLSHYLRLSPLDLLLMLIVVRSDVNVFPVLQRFVLGRLLATPHHLIHYSFTEKEVRPFSFLINKGHVLKDAAFEI
jgi:hypothetical protein